MITDLGYECHDEALEQVRFFQQVADCVDFKDWYFGHFHDNRELVDATMLFEEIQEIGKPGFVQRIGRPKYKVNEIMLFYILEDNVEYECYGRIKVVDEFGTLGQSREASYDLEGPDYRDRTKTILYKHFEESRLQSLNEFKVRD